MPTPAPLDLSLYLPLGGVNGFELNGHAVNGVGFVDSPFAGSIFELDPFRSILSMERAGVSIEPVLPSLVSPELAISVQRREATEATLWAPRCETSLGSERQETEIPAIEVSLELEVESVSLVPAEYRTAYVLADHPAKTAHTRRDSYVDELPPSQKPDEGAISYVPAEDRTTTVPRK